MGCSGSEFVCSKLASEAENGYLDLRIYLVTQTSKKAPLESVLGKVNY